MEKNLHNLFPKNECFLVSAFLHHIACLEGEGGGEVENGRTRLRKGRFFPSLLSLRAQFSSLPSLRTASAQARKRPLSAVLEGFSSNFIATRPPSIFPL